MGKEQKRKKSSFDYFDDCEICNAMKKADEENRTLSLGELKHVFRKQNAKQNKQIKQS